MSELPLHVEINKHVACIYFSRSSSDNGINANFAEELRGAIDCLEHNDQIRVLLITGSGGSFCVGTDFGSLNQNSIETFKSLKISDFVAGFSKPVIAVLNGKALDQGLETALACDFRLAAEGAKLGLQQVSNGLIPWDGGTQRLPRLVGESRAIEIILSGRLIDVDEAQSIGLVDDVFLTDELMDGAMSLAEIIAGHGPIAARYVKEAIKTGQDMSLDNGLRLEADLNILLHSTSDRSEGIQSFLEKRKPIFRGN